MGNGYANFPWANWSWKSQKVMPMSKYTFIQDFTCLGLHLLPAVYSASQSPLARLSSIYCLPLLLHLPSLFPHWCSLGSLLKETTRIETSASELTSGDPSQRQTHYSQSSFPLKWQGSHIPYLIYWSRYRYVLLSFSSSEKANRMNDGASGFLDVSSATESQLSLS